MNLMQLLFAGGIFVSVTLIAVAILLPIAGRHSRKRLEQVSLHTGYAPIHTDDDWQATIRKLASPLAKLSLPKEGWEDSPLKLRILQAGYRGESPVLLYFGCKTLLAVALPALAYLATLVAGANWSTNLLAFVLIGAAALGYYLPNVMLSHLVAVRKRELFETFPDAADLLLVCVESGLGLDAALARVTEEIRMKSEALGEELHMVSLELRAGASRESALRNLAIRTGVEEVNTFVTMLIQADRFGTSVGDSLRVFSEDLRVKRNQRAEELAAKVPLKLLFPLVLFIFPSLLLVMLGPAIIQVYRILLPTVTGQ